MLHFEDFAPGRAFALGPRAVSRDEIVAFAAEFDPQPFHLDEAAAEASLLGGLSASGWHTCATVMRMMVDGFLGEAASEGSPGVDEIKWLLPVRPGDTLAGEALVLEARRSRSRPNLGICRLRNTVRNGEARTVLLMEYAVMVRAAPEAGA